MPVKPSKKWMKMSAIYKRFATDSFYSFTEEDAQQAFEYESRGLHKHSIKEKRDGFFNGYYYGKQWMDLTITEYWLPDLREGKTLFLAELEEDYPEWFLKKVLNEFYVH